MNHNIPRILISSPKSGGGKTLFTSALCKVLVENGKRTAAFKCGPDYVDPKLHEAVTGREGSNLDLFFNSEELLKDRFCVSSSGCDLAVIEGAMGFYDGMGGITSINSACHISNCLKAPVVLIIDCEGASFSLCALIKGFLSFKENNIKAVVLNKCSKSLFTILKPVIEEECNISALGFIPKDERLAIRNVKLGLDISETEDIASLLDYMSQMIRDNIDLDTLLDIANNAEAIEAESKCITVNKTNLNVSVAKDDAFAFMYHDNIKFLEEAGCKITCFSPLHDNKVPDNTDLIIFGGGYQEKYCKELAENISMLSSVKDYYQKGGSVIAEGSGYSYICRDIKDFDGRIYKLCDILDVGIERTEKLSNFGYISLFDDDGNLALKAHEFHYSKADDDGSTFTAKRFSGKRSRKTIFLTDRLFCGFPQFDYCSNSEFFLKFLRNIKKK